MCEKRTTTSRGAPRRHRPPRHRALAPRLSTANEVCACHNDSQRAAARSESRRHTPQREPRRGAGTPAHGGPRSDVAIADRRGYADVGRITHRGSPPAPDIEPRGDSRTADDRRAARPALCPDRWAARARARVSAHRPARNHRHSAIASQFPRATPAGHARYRRESALYPKPGLPRYPIYYRGRIVACVYSERDHIDSILIFDRRRFSAKPGPRASAADLRTGTGHSRRQGK